MKKVMILFVAVIILTSFLIIAENNNSNLGSSDNSHDSENSNNSESSLSIEAEISNNSNEEQEQNQSDSNQNQEQNENSLDSTNKYQKRVLTQARVQKIIQTRNRLQIAKENGTCPQQCECEGSTMKCEFANGTKEMTIKAGNSGNTIIQVKNTNASTQVTLYKSDDGKVYGVFKNDETREIILPDEVMDKIKNQTRKRIHLENENITLNENGEYQVQARKRARLLWVIPVKERVQTRLDAETGEIIRTRTSWWGFLARDVRDSETQ